MNCNLPLDAGKVLALPKEVLEVRMGKRQVPRLRKLRDRDDRISSYFNPFNNNLKKLLVNGMKSKNSARYEETKFSNSPPKFHEVI
mmetsp:Transcript_28593/g.25307  ORF Transcript_28593/g.25307 Transcript_28593/m.25307 type:complete len:86 (+) Transcript_28593:20-277(+)